MKIPTTIWTGSRDPIGDWDPDAWATDYGTVGLIRRAIFEEGVHESDGVFVPGGILIFGPGYALRRDDVTMNQLLLYRFKVGGERENWLGFGGPNSAQIVAALRREIRKYAKKPEPPSLPPSKSKGPEGIPLNEVLCDSSSLSRGIPIVSVPVRGTGFEVGVIYAPPNEFCIAFTIRGRIALGPPLMPAISLGEAIIYALQAARTAYWAAILAARAPSWATPSTILPPIVASGSEEFRVGSTSASTSFPLISSALAPRSARLRNSAAEQTKQLIELRRNLQRLLLSRRIPFGGARAVRLAGRARAM